MIVIKENFIDNKTRKNIIKFYEKNKLKSFQHHKSYPLNVYDCHNHFHTKDIAEIKNIFLDIKNTCLQYINNLDSLSCYNLQITKWPANSEMPWHCDLDGTTFACILYLNNNYIGGKTILKTGEKINGSGKLLIIKDPDKINHSVQKILFGNRYTLSVWFCDQRSKYFKNKVNEILENL